MSRNDTSCDVTITNNTDGSVDYVETSPDDAVPGPIIKCQTGTLKKKGETGNSASITVTDPGKIKVIFCQTYLGHGVFDDSQITSATVTLNADKTVTVTT